MSSLLPLVAMNGGYSLLWYVGFSLRWLLLLRTQALGARASVVVACRLQSAGSVVVAHGLSCSAACGIFPEQGLNPCLLRWQVVLNHCATRGVLFFITLNIYLFIYLAALGLSCGMRALGCSMFSCSIRALSCGMHVGSSSLPGIEPGPPVLGAWHLNHWATREIPPLWFISGY